MTRIYEATSKIAIFPEPRNSLGFKDVDTQSADNYTYDVALETQAEILRSDTLGAKVIAAMHLDQDPRFTGERIPSLDEVLALAKGKVGVAIEIKNLPLPYPGIEDAIVQTVRGAGMVGDVVVISFDHRSVKRIAELEPQILTGVLEASRPVDILRVMDDAEADVFCPHWGSIEQETAQELHDAGKLIGVWTVDDAFSLAWSKALPANAIYTNKPRTIRP